VKHSKKKNKNTPKNKVKGNSRDLFSNPVLDAEGDGQEMGLLRTTASCAA